jgi:UDP:flavonoid glycosyltransferase YjiC (YdhE family)
MKRILFAWQLGLNYGHLGQDLPIAEALRDEGYEVVFAVPDLRLGAQYLRPKRFTYLMSPLPMGSRNPPYPPGNLAEILLAAGFAEELTCMGLIEGWCHLIEMIRPDALVLDYSPFALVATRCLGIPAVQVSAGFDVAPSANPLPSIRPWEATPVARLRAADALVLKRVNAALASQGKPLFSSVAALFESAPALLTTFPELDPYGARPGATYVGPISSAISSAEVEWPQSDRRIFAYLRTSVPGIQGLLEGLANCGAGVICALPDAPDTLRKRYHRETFRLVPHAIALDPVLARADAVITYGGAATTAAALLAGVPLLIAAELVEQQLTALRVQELGAGIVMGAARSPSDVAQALQRLSAASYREAARAFAAKYAAYDSMRAVRCVTTLVATVAGWLPRHAADE